MPPSLPTTGRWVAIKRGNGTITGWAEVFAAGGTWVTMPDVSRFVGPKVQEASTRA